MPLSANQTKRPPLLLIILDGWGIAPPSASNAITLAKTPTMDRLWKTYPHTQLQASGLYVGLPENQVGNSEAGHLNIGAGRVVVQDSTYISESISDGTFFKNPAFLEAIQHIKRRNSHLHIMGILSNDQCPHMSPGHLTALSRLAKMHNIRFFLHFFTDGRDTHPHSAIDLWNSLKKMLEPGVCEIGSVSGRLYLDRKKTWERTEQIYNALVLGKSDYESPDFESAVKAAYKRGESDEFISPTIIRSKSVTAADIISDGDSIIFYNLRSDRARQFTKPFVQEQFEQANQDAFRRAKILKNIRFVAMTDFGPDLGPVLTAYPSRDVHQSLPMVLKNHYRQLYISETEKYAHITYFFNGGYTEPIAGEHRILVRSKAVRSYQETPEMSAKEITAVVLEVLRQKWYNFICINFPNADMMGHTGNIESAVIACQAVDSAIAKILQEVEKNKGEAVITADHGNAENIGEEVVENGESVINTMHEKNPVPLIIYTKKKIALKDQDSNEPTHKLADIAPTILALEGIPKPKDMTGESLII